MTSITKLSRIRLRITEIDLCAWLGQASPGDVIEYHRGFLALDGTPVASRLPETERGELLRGGRRALWAAEQRLAHLVQLRHGDADYSYFAIARPRSRSAPVSLSELMMAEVA